MNQDLVIGLMLFAFGVVLLYIGMPKKGVSPRFLQFDSSVVVYPPLVMVFIAAGAVD
jgi:hypothetical protein